MATAGGTPASASRPAGPGPLGQLMSTDAVNCYSASGDNLLRNGVTPFAYILAYMYGLLLFSSRTEGSYSHWGGGGFVWFVILP